MASRSATTSWACTARPTRPTAARTSRTRARSGTRPTGSRPRWPPARCARRRSTTTPCVSCGRCSSSACSSARRSPRTARSTSTPTAAPRASSPSAGSCSSKNDGGRLPLDLSAVRTIAVIGEAADDYAVGAGSSQVAPTRTITPLDGDPRAGRSRRHRRPRRRHRPDGRPAWLPPPTSRSWSPRPARARGRTVRACHSGRRATLPRPSTSTVPAPPTGTRTR